MASAMNGKVVLVTGATSGIGAATAAGLARAGAHVIVVGRDAARAKVAVEGIRRQTSSAAIDILIADLSSQADIRRLARAVYDGYPRLDVLVNNAGGLFTKRERTLDGFERTWALNHLSYFLLTLELLDLLRANAPARIVNVASAVHATGTMNFEALQKGTPPIGMEGYKQSKLANVMFTYALARRLEGTGVSVNALHPGVVATRFGRNGGPASLLLLLVRPFMISAERGAATSVFLASSPEVEGVSGRYFVKCRETRSSDVSGDRSLQDRLWDLSVRQTQRRAT